MNVFVKDLLNVVTGQEAPDFNFVLSALLVYLALLWLAFCAWVFVDASKRYGKWYVALTVSLVVFVLNFPALIFYLVVRPDDERSVVENHTGVEVPVVKFIDENGNVRLALNLEISGQQNPKSDMTVSVAWDSARQDIDINRRKTEPKSKSKKKVIAGEEVPTSAEDTADKVKKLAKLFAKKRAAAETESVEANLIK